MKSPHPVPSMNELVRAMNLLQSKPLSGTSFLRLFPLTRFDPRITEVMIEGIARDWRKIDPRPLGDDLKSHPWKRAAGFLMDCATYLIPPAERSSFRRWSRAVVAKPTQPSRLSAETFWIGLYSPGSRNLERQLTNCLPIYRRWGFVGADLPLNQSRLSSSTDRSWMDAPARRRLLDHLLSRGESFTANDYRQALGGGVSRRLAELDLSRHPGVAASGRTRNRVYFRAVKPRKRQ